MSYIIATGSTARSRVRTLSMRPLLAVALAAALSLLAAGSGIGWWLARATAPSPAVAATAEPARAALPYTLEQLGAISGRMFRLESEAAQLSRRIGLLAERAPAAASTGDRRVAPSRPPLDGSGGPLLPARPEADASAAAGGLDARLAGIEQRIAALADATGEQRHEQMRLPSRPPLAEADLTASFGNRLDPFARRRAFHEGLDFAAEAGTPITAAAGGTVQFAGVRADYGRMVEIDHGNGLVSRYAHASRLLVQPGQVVVPGDRIAEVGSSGRSTGPHLHFEVLRGGQPVDPQRFLAGP